MVQDHYNLVIGGTMRITVRLVLLWLKRLVPPIVAVIATELLTIEDEYLRYIVFLAWYVGLLLGSLNTVDVPALPLSIRKRTIMVGVVVSVAAAIYLGLFGQLLAVTLLGMMMAELHESHILLPRIKTTDIAESCLVYGIILLLSMYYFFTISSGYLGVAFGYAFHLFRESSKSYDEMKKKKIRRTL